MASTSALLKEIGTPLSLEEKALPPIVLDEIRVKVLYAGVNFYESMILSGTYPAMPALPAGIGGECLGEVIEVGKAVSALSVGDKIVSLAQTGFGTSGAFAQQANLKARYVFKAPDGVNEKTLAAMPMAYFTAWLLAHTRVSIQDGDTVLIHSAAGGVGLALVDLLHAGTWKNLTIIGTCSSAEKAAFLKQRGVDVAIDTTEKAWSAQAQETYQNTVDVIFDANGAAYLDSNLEALKANGGQICSYGAYSGPITDGNLVGKLRKKNLSLSGFLMWPLIEDRALCEKVFGDLFSLLRADKIKPQVGEVFSLQEVNEAFSYLRGRKNKGKILIKPN